ncbi:MAG: polyketide synthase dehydratase domain-containing protein [Clostridia bacterium]|nr:polyketide synthase dehydratase domain-containing protein [Clostridia bacterium]
MAVEMGQEDYLLLLKKSLSTIKKLDAELEMQRKEKEPIAIIGMGFRFPGGSHDPQTFWEFLTEGRDGVIGVPKDRWCIDELNVPGVHLREAGFLHENVGEFDAHFFGISPREAVEMDPQQRLLLEVSWEALERAGIAPSKLQGTKTGVFIGIIGSDYSTLPRKDMNPYFLTGSLPNIASGRISYILGTHGPAISVDTACSSSLVAVHLACESLRRGESTLALAGGVSLMLSPAAFISLCSFNAIAEDGRCKTFDAGGDGYGRGEGCGAVVLKRLSDAIKDKDPILAVIRGTGVNQDGPGSGLTVPNGTAQKELILKTLEESNVSPEEISYFEAHGTGTSLGDPIEVQALTEVFGKKTGGRTEPLIIGSLKSNIGHLEAAAGIASLIKIILCLQNKEIPPNLNLKTLNPRIHLERIPAIVPQKTIPWGTAGKPRMAGISSFGFSGTNAYAIVAEPPKDMSINNDLKPACERPLHILALSAKSENVLMQLITKYKSYFENPNNEKLENICFTANTGRTHFTRRISFAAENPEQMKSKLAEYLQGNPESGINGVRGKENADSKLVFIFNGKTNIEICKSLFDTQPVFRKALLSCNERLQQFADTSFLDSVLINDLKQDDSIPGYMKDVISFSLQYSLLKLWESWGVKPSAVLGSGNGQFAAACAAGVMSMETALLFILENQGIALQADAEKVLNQFKIRMISAAGEGFIEKQEAVSSRYWERVLSIEPKIRKGIEYLIQQGYKHFLEIGPVDEPDYQGDVLINSSISYFSFPSCGNPWRALVNILGSLYCSGVDIDWSGFDQGYDRHKVVLPTYPFQRKYFWCDAIPFNEYFRKMTGIEREESAGSSLDGRIINSPVKEKQIEYSLSLDAIPDLKDTHGVLHVGYYFEILYRAVRKIYNRSFVLKSIEFLSALIVPEKSTLNMSLILLAKERGEIEFSFYGCKESNNWSKHTQGVILIDDTSTALQTYRDVRADIINQCQEQYSGTEFYRKLQERGILLGESVQCIENVWCREGEALARFKQSQKPDTSNGYETGVHPGVFDACAQLFHAALPQSADKGMKYMVTRWEGFSFNPGDEMRELWCHAVLRDSLQAPDLLTGTFQLLDQDGKLIAQISNGLMKGISKEHEDAFKKYMESEAAKGTEGESETLNNLRCVTSDKWGEIITGYLQHLFASILRMEASEIDINESLMDLGMDSLVGVEAKLKIEKEFRIFLPLELLIQGPSIQKLGESIIPLVPVEPGRSDSLKADSIHKENKIDISRWIVHRKTNPSAKIKLFCFPYGGGGASIYRRWQTKLPDHIEICPVQLPGRENRIKEKAFVDIGTAVKALKEMILPELDRPYAFYGHSVGALVSYRLAYELWKEVDNKPKHVFAGGYSSPVILPNPFLAVQREKFQKLGYEDIPAPEILSSATPEQAKKILEITGGIPGPETDINEELIKVFLPIGLADLQLVNSFSSIGEAAFDVPISAVHGKKDIRVNEPEMRQWKKLTKGAFKLHILPGDHLFLHEEQDQKQLLELICKQLEKYV